MTISEPSINNTDNFQKYLRGVIETHAHYDYPQFDPDRAALFDEMKQAGIIAVVNVAANLQSSLANPDFIKQQDFLYGTLGIHPGSLHDLNESSYQTLVDTCRKCANQSSTKIVAIGEIGLDYYHPDSDRAAQQEWFIRQINLATEFSLPIIIHSRDAAADTLSILKTNSGNQPRLVHCFSYSKEIAAEYLKMGDYYFGIGGVVTFKNAKKLHESVYHIPLERLLLETDSPYLTPHPYRGKRNSSLYLGYIVSAIAQIKAIAPELVIEQTTKNAKEFYGIS